MTNEPGSPQTVGAAGNGLVLLLLALQLLGLWAINLAGVWIVDLADVPIPGNLVGMIGLYLLLSCGLVKLAWFDATGSFLIKHLAFFFIPITVGLMDADDLFAAYGLEIALVLVVSAAVGILLSGVVAESVARLTHDEEGMD